MLKKIRIISGSGLGINRNRIGSKYGIGTLLTKFLSPQKAPRKIWNRQVSQYKRHRYSPRMALSSISPTLPPGNRLSGAGGSFSGPPESGSKKSTVRSVYLREKDFALSPAKITFLRKLAALPITDVRCLSWILARSLIRDPTGTKKRRGNI